MTDGNTGNDKHVLLEIQSHLRKEIEWRSKTCMHTWFFLATATGLIYREIAPWCGVGAEITCLPGNEILLKIHVALAFVSLVWMGGLWYIIEKRTWISNIGHYLRHCVEPALFKGQGINGWEYCARWIRHDGTMPELEPRTCGNKGEICVGSMKCGKWNPYHVLYAETGTGIIVISFSIIVEFWAAICTEGHCAAIIAVIFHGLMLFLVAKRLSIKMDHGSKLAKLPMCSIE